MKSLELLRPRHYVLADLLVCLPFLLIPLLINLPFRVNIFLSWEGAYRLSLGQVPFRDFGLPMGYGYWMIPSLFFMVFGPTFSALIYSQVLINLVSLLSIRSIFYNLDVKPALTTLLLLVFSLSYVIYNFWPWYNHSVVVFELASLAMLTAALVQTESKLSVVNLIFSALLAFLSFFTKQDAGAICILICLGLLIYNRFLTGSYKPLLVFGVTLALVAAVVIVPLMKYDFLYWFNYGQAPHDSRVTIGKLMDIVLGDAQWEKVYLGCMLLIMIAGGKQRLALLFYQRKTFMLTFICLAMVGQAVITRATSPLPTDHMTYFHTFGIAGIIGLLSLGRVVVPARSIAFGALMAIVLFSPGYWKYVRGVFHIAPTTRATQEASPSSPWVSSSLRGFEKVLMPPETVEGMERLVKLYGGSGGKLKVLNMSELTPLALSMNYKPGTGQPLWYHLNIGIFDKEVDEFCQRIQRHEFDVVLFEDIPNLTHFYPYEVRDSLRRHYTLQDSFLAPRKDENSTIEVYVRRSDDKGASSAPPVQTGR